jgi:hypothetical protein
LNCIAYSSFNAFDMPIAPSTFQFSPLFHWFVGTENGSTEYNAKTIVLFCSFEFWDQTVVGPLAAPFEKQRNFP